MAITSVGLGSGLDINAMVESIAEAERAPKQAQIDRQTAKTDTTISAIGTLTSAVEAFEAALTSLETVSTSFDGLNASSSSATVASVTAGEGAVTGSYSLEVTSLATASKVATASQAGGASTRYASGGTLSIDVGNNSSYNVKIAEGATLTQIRDSINSQLSSSAGISANIITDSTGSRLVLSSETTGEGTDLFVKGTGDLAALNVNVDGAGNHSLVQQTGTAAGSMTMASNAAYKLDGLDLTSSTNNVTALSGMTIKLTGEGRSTLTVGANTAGLKTSIETFVAAYNNLITVTNALTKVSPTGDGSSTESGALVGDASVRSLLSSVRSTLVEPSSSDGISTLAQLGVTTNKDGTLSIDKDKLTAGLATNYADVEEFFVGDEGLITRLKSATEPYTATGGLLETRTESLTDAKADLVEQQEALDQRMETLTTNLYKKYNYMDSLVAQLNATSDSVMTTLNALNNPDN